MLVNDIDARKHAVIDCITDIERWCRSHGLKLNADKSDVIWLGSRQQLVKINQADRNLHLPSGTLRASETVHNLGVIIDQHLTFEAQARACSKACFYQQTSTDLFLNEKKTANHKQPFLLCLGLKENPSIYYLILDSKTVSFGSVEC